MAAVDDLTSFLEDGIEEEEEDQVMMEEEVTDATLPMPPTVPYFDALSIGPSKSKVRESEDDVKSDSKSKKVAKIPEFNQLSAKQLRLGKKSYRAVKVPGYRMIHIRRLWKSMCQLLVKQLKLQVRMNSKKNLIEMRVCTFIHMANSPLHLDTLL